MTQGSLPAARTIAQAPSKIPGVDRKTLLSAGSVLAGLGAVACCAAPMILLSLGASGAWIGSFNVLYPYKPYFIATAVVLLAAGFVSVYRKPKGASCDGERACRGTRLHRLNKVALWVATVLVTAALGLPYAAPWFLGVL